jgi:group II intron reverse transcriptase/maturase
MRLTVMAQKQMDLARTALNQPTHRFTNLYRLLHWDEWMESAAERVLARPGSSTAGVDGKTRDTFKRHHAEYLSELVATLKDRTYMPQPVRRVYIPKSNGKMRPLGIPALKDRIVQEALRAILDPIFESDFRPHSYGFRLGRRTMDAIAVLMPLFNDGAKHFYVIEGDIKSYFDTVHHRKLLSLLKRRIADKDIITLVWKFLKAGVMEDGLFARTDKGVPQGGVISPLLANVYLHELDKWADARWNLTPYERQRRRSSGQGNYRLVRFADDFVIVSNDTIANVRAVKEQVRDFLATELHLTLSEEKTRITHVNDGFDFLGFHIQRVKHDDGRAAVHLRPSEKATERVCAKLTDLTSRGWTWMDEYTRLTTLNAIVRGWAEYYRHTSLVADIEHVTRHAWHRYLLWLLKKLKGSRKHALVTEKTRTIHGRTRWTAHMREGDLTLTAHQWLPTRWEYKRSRYHQKGRNGFPHPYLSPDGIEDADYPMGDTGPDESIYIATVGASSRRGEPLGYAETKLRVKLRDGLRCTRCGGTDKLRVHHTKGTRTHWPDTLVTVCLDCHKAEHGYRTTRPNGEPDEAKVSRPVRREG